MSPTIIGNAVVVKSNYGENPNSGFYVKDMNDGSNVFYIKHATVSGIKHSYIKGAEFTYMAFINFREIPYNSTKVSEPYVKTTNRAAYTLISVAQAH